MKPFQCTKLTELLVFQFNLLHRRLLTNTFPKKINLIDSDLCSFVVLKRDPYSSLLELQCHWRDLRVWSPL